MKNIVITITILLFATSGFSQQNLYKWRLGAYGGVSTYYGDLNSRVLNANKFILDDLWNNRDYISYGASLEHSAKKGFGMKLMWSMGKVTSNDRAVNFSKELQTQRDNFDRSLNFSTNLMDLGLMGTFYTDNGKIFSDDAFLSPYLSIGVGLTYFDVKGDLFLEDGSRYYYWSDKTIRDKAEGDATAEIIEQDGVFETNLTDLETEDGYKQFALNIPAAFGLKFRLSNRFNLNLETAVKYTFTDYLDDVSGDYTTSFQTPGQAYAHNPNNQSGRRGSGNDKVNDFYAFTSISLHYNFGFRKDGFIAPMIYTNLQDGMPEVVVAETLDPKTAVIPKETTIQPIPDDMKANVIVAPSTKETVVVIDPLDNLGNKVTEQTTIQPIPENMNAEVPVAPSTKETVVVADPLGNIGNEVTRETTIQPIPEDMNAEVIVAPSTRETITVPNALPEKEMFIEYEAPLLLLPEPQEVVLLGVKEDQLELTKLQSELIQVETGVQDVAELERIEDELVTITENVEFFEEYNNEIAIKANDEFSEPNNVEIRDNTTDLRKELDKAKADLAVAKKVALEQQPITRDSAELMRLEMALGETNKKIAQLEIEVSSMKTVQAEKIEAASKVAAASTEVVAETALETKEAVTTETAVKKEPIIVETPPTDAPAEVKYYSNEVSRINKEVENMEAAPENSALDQEYINKLKARSDFIDSQLSALDRTENSAEIKKYNRQLKADNRELNAAIRNLEKKEATQRRLKELQEKSQTTGNTATTPVEKIPAATTVAPTPTPPPVVKEKVVVAPPTVAPTIIKSDANAEYKDEIAELRKEIEALRNKETGNEAGMNAILAKIAELENQLKKPVATDNSANVKYMEETINSLQKTVDALREENRRLASSTTKSAPSPTPPVVINRTIVAPRTALTAIRGYEVTNIYFDNGLSVIKPEFFGKLDKLIALMLQYPEINATLKGFTDKSGNPDLNFRLSRHRAAQVKAYLIRRGIDNSRIEDNYFGDAQAAAKNDPYSRRVEVTLILN